MPPPVVVAVSAPGKVLFAGGFLVLDRKHTGLVFGLDARIHVHVEPWLKGSTGAGTAILVQSPQFHDASWLYEISGLGSEKEKEKENDDHVAVSVRQVQDHANYTQTANKFVETTLLYALTYLTHVSKDVRAGLKITILADDDYYSQSTESSKPATTTPSRFSSFGVKLSDAHKTGLGSSAALVTSLVSALLAFHAAQSGAETILPHRTIHNLAQAAHCAAQGKVGSGFDVAAAVYGSSLYRRFTPTILEAVGEPTTPGFSERLHQCVDDLESDRKWDVEVASQAVQIPESLVLVMCDVDCGSETPGMVRKVLQWRKEQAEEADLLWNALQHGTDDLCQELRRLAQTEGIHVDGFKGLADLILTIRSLVREMSAKSKVPIEPAVITELLDFCTSLPGVVGGVAPGAGGYDAVALLVKNDGDSVQDLQRRLDGWKSRDDTGAQIGHVRLLGVKQEKEGVRREEPATYAGWV